MNHNHYAGLAHLCDTGQNCTNCMLTVSIERTWLSEHRQSTLGPSLMRTALVSIKSHLT